jgi:CRAL/TRIO domain
MAIDTSLSLSERWSDANFQQMVQLWNLKAEDEVNLRKLQKRIQDMDHWKNDPFEVVRYYKTYKSVAKTEKMFRQMVEWRMEHDMDTYLERHGEPDPLWLQLPCAMLDTQDKEGDPILLDRLGACDSLGLYMTLGGEAFCDYAVYVRELMCSPAFWKHYEAKHEGRRVRNFNLIVDLEDLHGGPLKPGLIRVLQKVARIVQDCYAGWEKVSGTYTGTSMGPLEEVSELEPSTHVRFVVYSASSSYEPQPSSHTRGQ